MNTQHISRVALFAALIAALGLVPPVAIPLAGGVPITAQTLGVMLAALVLGPRLGSLAVLCFLLLLALGMPLLSGGRGGLAVFVSPSAGFLWGWLPACFVTASIYRYLPVGLNVTWRAAISCLLGCVGVLYCFGIAGLVIIAELEPFKALMGSLLFVPGDLVKSALAGLIMAQLVRARPSLLEQGIAS